MASVVEAEQRHSASPAVAERVRHQRDGVIEIIDAVGHPRVAR